MKLKDKVVLITGASSGIGQATATAFAKEDTKIAIVYRSNQEGAEETEKAVKEAGSEVISIQADVSEPKDVDMIFEKVVKEFGTVDILINNAGITTGMPFLESTRDHWLEQINTNLLGPVFCSQKAVEIMLKQGAGKILNTSSIRGLNHTGREGIMAYSAIKAALNNFTLTLAKELSPEIQVNAIAPGFVYTHNYDSMDEDLKKEFVENTQIKRFINVEEIAEGFLFLAKSDAITGEILVIDGGFTLKNG